ncbi:CaiF/GrlA family transcriptional regulator [Salmonella enterica subsp. enterica]|nr:CaiF/GrlA family transcriptional regulator [Salmonella enterica subsp. enterica]
MDTRISHRPPGPHRIPDILQDAPYRDLPLYMLVAWWVYRQTVPVSVRDVSEAFHISARRAGDLPPRKPVVAPVPERKSPPARRRAPSPAIRDLRAWMVSRRPGEPVPVEDTGTLSDGEAS